MVQQTLWQQTVTQIKQGLLARKHSPGTKFPSLTELSKQYEISKITALRVVSELEKSGLVRRIPRKGTIITGQNKSYEIKVLLDFRQNWPANALPILWKYMRGIEQACEKINCKMQVVSVEHAVANPNPNDRYILLTMDPESPVYLKFSEKGCRHVCLHSHSRLPQHDCIRIDHKSGGRIMTQMMLDAGHRRIAYVGGPAHSPWHAPRLKGYLDVLENNNLPLDLKLAGEITTSIPNPEDAASAVEHLLSLSQPPTAIVVSDDLRALAVMAYLKSKGISVPDEISISGMDARIEATDGELPLTTCDWQLEKQGETAVNYLMNPVQESDTPTDILVESKLVKGQTIKQMKK